VYFPTTAIVSLLYVMENGASAEIAVVGNEGIVGISLFMGGETHAQPGRGAKRRQGFRLRPRHQGGVQARGPVMHLLLRYTQALITQMAQTAVCNRHHSLDQQLCRWLLLSLDRLQGNELVMTQELIANMLGVRREGVTEGALKLQKAGLIRYARGHITVLDRKGWSKRTCECYAVVKKEYGPAAHYGANIFVVDLVGYAMLREFAPLITAIIIAGRSGSAYAAQIGTMVVTEEIDAMRTIGIDAARVLVLPKILALADRAAAADGVRRHRWRVRRHDHGALAARHRLSGIRRPLRPGRCRARRC
jgi:hypothetical protein